MNGNGRDRDDGIDAGAGSDYLWDRSGAVDPDVARLERLLGGFAHDRDARRPHARTATPLARRPRRRLRIAFAAAAVLAVCAIGLQGWWRQRLQWEPGRPWAVVAQRGDVRVDGRARHAIAALATGGTLETGGDGVVRLRAAQIGEIALGAGSTLRLVETRTGRHRLQLQQGRMWARIWAPPGQFGVGIPGADVLDLGCEFVVDSDAAGNGSLTVRSGWVQVEDGWREVLVPEGTTVRLHAGAAPGTPRDLGATPAFVAALDAIDAAEGDVDPSGTQVRSLIAASRPKDAISLVSLLQHSPRLAAGPLFDRTAQLLPGAAPVSRTRVLARDADALDAWRHALPYPRIKRWWLQWPDALPSRDKLDTRLRPPPVAG